MRITNALWPEEGQETEVTVITGTEVSRVSGRYLDTVYTKDGSAVDGHLMVTVAEVNDPQGGVNPDGTPKTVDILANLYVRHGALTSMAWERLPDELDGPDELEA